MTLEQAIDRYTNNAEYERIHGSLQGCLDFRQLAEWLKDYKRLLEQEPCDDVVSRILTRMWNCRGKHTTSIDKVKMEQIIRDELPSVTRQTGEWIIDSTVVEKTRQYIMHECGHRRITNYHMDVHCSECGFKYAYTTDKEDSIPTNFCPNCGAKMESEKV